MVAILFLAGVFDGISGNPIHSVLLFSVALVLGRDVSLGGLLGMSNNPLGRGERITVFFPPEGPARGWDAYGRVLRCEASPTGGYRVAVAFDPLPAA